MTFTLHYHLVITIIKLHDYGSGVTASKNVFILFSYTSGYLGPGGLHDNGDHWNCTGGAAGAIDRFVLGESHMYRTPTSRVRLHLCFCVGNI